MSIAAANTERTKLGYLLELSHQQIEALECDDMFAFDRILAEKRSLIESLGGDRRPRAADSPSAGIVARIQEADQMAMRLLYDKVGRIMREMHTLNRQKKARGAYGRAAQPKRPVGFLPDTPRYLDTQS